MSKITGVVYDDRTGERIENATVVIGNESDLTDQEGNYALTANPGKYTMKVIHRLYARYIIPVEIIASVEYDIPLTKIA